MLSQRRKARRGSCLASFAPLRENLPEQGSIRKHQKSPVALKREVFLFLYQLFNQRHDIARIGQSVGTSRIDS